MGHFYKAVVTFVLLNTKSEFKEKKKCAYSDLLETEDKIGLLNSVV